MSARNIVIFGETGAGKSSVVNLMAGREVAKTSPDMPRCTLHWEEHVVTLGESRYKVFDTVGLQHPHVGMEDYLNIIVNAHSLITKLASEGGIDLLLFCVRAGRHPSTFQRNYQLYHEWLCEKKVPVVLIVTGLEDEERMEDYWTRNHDMYLDGGIDIVDHACITAKTKRNERQQQLYEESHLLIRDLVIKHTQGVQEGAFTGGDRWFRKLMQSVWELRVGKVEFTPKRQSIEAVLTRRCGMERTAARELASRITSDLDGRPRNHSSASRAPRIVARRHSYPSLPSEHNRVEQRDGSSEGEAWYKRLMKKLSEWTLIVNNVRGANTLTRSLSHPSAAIRIQELQQS